MVREGLIDPEAEKAKEAAAARDSEVMEVEVCVPAVVSR